MPNEPTAPNEPEKTVILTRSGTTSGRQRSFAVQRRLTTTIAPRADQTQSAERTHRGRHSTFCTKRTQERRPPDTKRKDLVSATRQAPATSFVETTPRIS